MKKYNEFSGQCQYHFGELRNDMRVVQLTPDNREWQRPIAICSDCREYLRGHFKYAKPIKNIP